MLLVFMNKRRKANGDYRTVTIVANISEIYEYEFVEIFITTFETFFPQVSVVSEKGTVSRNAF